VFSSEIEVSDWSPSPPSPPKQTYYYNHTRQLSPTGTLQPFSLQQPQKSSQEPPISYSPTNEKEKKQQLPHKWTTYRHFIPHVPLPSTPSSNKSSCPHQTFTPCGTNLPSIDNTETLLICMQNSQYAFQIYGDGIKIQSIIDNLKNTGATMYAPIRSNINWHNNMNWTQTKHLFRPAFHQVHISAISSDVGLEVEYKNKSLVGGAALLTFGLWSSKVSQHSHDLSGYGTYTITSIQGTGQKTISFISAYIAVSKGTNISTESVYAQPVSIYEKVSLKKKTHPDRKFCPCSDAIKCLNSVFHDLQQIHYAIIVMIDANQTLSECSTSKDTKAFSIEWLRIQRGMDDPIRILLGQHPNSTTIHPNRDIDFILTFGNDVDNISTLIPDYPAHSDHLGIALDVNLKRFFSSTFSDASYCPPQSLSSGNGKSVTKYINYVSVQFLIHKIPARLQSLHNKIDSSSGTLQDDDADLLNLIDTQVTEILLAGE